MAAIALELEAQNDMMDSTAEPENTDGKVFIGGLSWETTSDSLRYHFEKFGELSDVALMADKRTGQPRGFGFVSYKDPAAVDIVLAQPSHNIDGRTVDVKRAVPRDRAPAPSAGRQESRKIFVGGLSPEVNEKEFNEYFSKYGPIQDSIVMYDKKTNRSRGFGFVTFEAEEGVQAVLSSEHEIMGKWVEIKRAEPRDMNRNAMDHMGGYGYRPDNGRGPMRGGMRGGMGGRGGYDDYSGYSAYMGMGGRGGSYGYGYGGEGGYAGNSMTGRGGSQGYAGYGYGGSSMPAGGYYGQAGGAGGYAGYGNAAAPGPQGGGYRGLGGYGSGGRSGGALGAVGADRAGLSAGDSRSAMSSYGPGYGAATGRGGAGDQGAGWAGAGYGGGAATSPRQDGSGYPDYRAGGGAPGGRQDRQYRPY